jgi:HEAT repeat protein
LSDPNDRVRLEAAKALANLPTPAAAEPLIKMVTNPEEDRDIRIAAAAALNHYKKIEVARALASRLQERDFSVAWQARESLRKLTKKDFRYNEARWLEYLSGPEKPFG